jgi:hypothetical protein
VPATLAPRCLSRGRQVGVNSYQAYSYIREFTDRPMTTLEATASCAAKTVLDIGASLVVVASQDPAYIRYVCKYRPRVRGRGWGLGFCSRGPQDFRHGCGGGLVGRGCGVGGALARAAGSWG